jgi:hypothetical protein
MSKLTAEERKRALQKALASGFYAACEDGHPFWSGPDRTTYSEADQDAKSHDQRAHNDGSAHAVVLPI